LPNLPPMGSYTFSVRDILNEAVLEKLSTVRVVSEAAITGVQLVNYPDGDLVGLPALHTTSREWLFPIATQGNDLALWTVVNLFNASNDSTSATIEAFNAENTSLGVIQTTTILARTVHIIATDNVGGVIPRQTVKLKVTSAASVS